MSAETATKWAFTDSKTFQILLDCSQNVSWKVLGIISADLLDTEYC